MDLPKWGRSHTDIDEFGKSIISRISQIAVEIMTNPFDEIKNQFVQLAEIFGTEEYPLESVWNQVWVLFKPM